MLLLLALAALLAVTLIGWGLLGAAALERAAGIGLSGSMALGEHGLLGLACLAAAGLALHWLVALDAAIGLCVVAIGLGAVILCRRRLWAALGFGLSRAISGGLSAALLVLIVGIVVRQDLPYDSGLYHLQTILMTEDSRVVLGAANIHDRFGYNSAWLLLCAMLALPGAKLGAAEVLNGLAAFFVLSGMAQRIASGSRRAAPLGACFAVGGILLIGFAKLLPHTAGGPGTDLPAALFTIYSVLLLLAAIETPPERRLDAEALGPVLLAFPIAALAVACKASQAPVAAAVVLVALALLPRRAGLGRRVMLTGAASALLLGLAWIGHGLALSGCVLYPVSGSCLGIFPWVVPAEVADADRAWITAFGRVPDASHGRVPDDWRWLPAWWEVVRADRFVVSLKIALGLAGGFLTLRLAGRGRLRCAAEALDPAGLRAALGLMAVLVAGLCYWFLTAPALRFGYGFLISSPLLLIALLAPVGGAGLAPRRIGRAVTIGAVALALYLAAATVAAVPEGMLLATDRPAIPLAEVAERRTAAGDLYYAPVADDRCWASPRFCTPHASPGLTFGTVGLWRTATATP